MRNSNISLLELVDHRFPALLNGEKRDTIRWNEGNVDGGYMIYQGVNNKNLQALVWVTETIYLPLKAVPIHSEDSKGEDTSVLLNTMKKHYPTITLETEILLVKHLTPAETILSFGIPVQLQTTFDSHYIDKILNLG